MAFDINEARAIVEEAKKRGLIRGSDAKSFDSQQVQSGSKPDSPPDAEIGHLPDWLQKGIREPEPTEEANKQEGKED